MKNDTTHLGRLMHPIGYGGADKLLEAGLPYAMDNGAFTGFKQKHFEKILRYAEKKPGCLFVAARDVVGDAEKTMEHFDEWAGKIHGHGLPVAYVLQDGQHLIEPPWSDLEAVFIGGSTGFKMSATAARIAREAKRRKKHVHMGRVNSPSRFEYAYDLGVDTIDGSCFGRHQRHLIWATKLLGELNMRPPRQLNAQATIHDW